MIFLCFSSKDRYTIVKSILYHLKNYGVEVWYDYHELTLGDNRIGGNFTKGLDCCESSIIILSPNIFDCKCGNDEIDEIKHRYEQGNIHIFPLLYNIKASELPEKYLWITEFIYNEIEDSTGTLSACNQIVCMISQKILDNYLYRKLADFIDIKHIEPYIKIQLNIYFSLSEDNYSSKLTILYLMYQYIIHISKASHTFPFFCTKTIKRLFSFNKLNIQMPHKEIIIAENILVILINIILSSADNR